jgi:hypothetical protein
MGMTGRHLFNRKTLNPASHVLSASPIISRDLDCSDEASVEGLDLGNKGEKNGIIVSLDVACPSGEKDHSLCFVFIFLYSIGLFVRSALF